MKPRAKRRVTSTPSRAAVSVMKASSRIAQEVDRALAAADLTLPQFNVVMVFYA